MIRRPPRSTLDRSSAASDVYKRQVDSLMTYLKKFDYTRPLLQTSEALELAAYDVVQQAAMDNILYLSLIHISEPTRPY